MTGLFGLVALVAPSRRAERARTIFALGAKEPRAFDVDRAEDAWLWLTGLESD